VSRPLLLDTFCGAGGCSVGYHRAGFDVVGVDNRHQKNYPYPFILGDALEFIAEHGAEFDVIHASPPCQRYSEETPMEYRDRHPDLIDPVREALRATGRPYIIENVPNARGKLIRPLMLCGTMFGLNVWRHRFFEVYPFLSVLTPTCNHSGIPVLPTGTHKRKDGQWDDTIADKRRAMEIDWMIEKEITQAIPPAYTEWIGRQLLEVLDLA
jgi:DNA (cytosine-5)-methyltransferase 1